MTDEYAQLRKEIESRLQPPIEVLLDPSLVSARKSLKRLEESIVFESQRQATLGQTPTTPRIGEIYIPGSFLDWLEIDGQSDTDRAKLWEFFRGQADGARHEEIIELVTSNRVARYENELGSEGLNFDRDVSTQLRAILTNELAFVSSGGVVLSRISAPFDQLRDAGVATVDVGRASLDPTVHERLTEVGYRNPAQNVTIGVGSVPSTVDALVGQVLDSSSDILLYHIGT